jgi:hypothetical protein
VAFGVPVRSTLFLDSTEAGTTPGMAENGLRLKANSNPLPGAEISVFATVDDWLDFVCAKEVIAPATRMMAAIANLEIVFWVVMIGVSFQDFQLLYQRNGDYQCFERLKIVR